MVMDLGHLKKQKEQKSNYKMTKEERFRELKMGSMFYDTQEIGCYLVRLPAQDNKPLKIEASIATGNGPDHITITEENLDRYENIDRALDYVDPHIFAALTVINLDVQAIKPLAIQLALKTGLMTRDTLNHLIGEQS